MSSVAKAAAKPLLFRQLFDRASCTFTYLLCDPTSRDGILIDPVLELVDRDLQVCRELGVKLKARP